MKRRRVHSLGRAFSLIELLVVIGIIGVLIALLLPVVASVRRQANQVKCSSNLRQLVSAAILHAHEHMGYLPLAGELVFNSSSGGTNRIPMALGDKERRRYTYAIEKQYGAHFQLVALPGALAPYMGIKHLDYNDAQVLDQQLNDTGGVWKMFMCPATDSFTRSRRFADPADTTPVGQGMLTVFMDAATGATWGWSTNTDYAVNEGAFGFHHLPQYASRRAAGRLSRLSKTGEVMLFADAGLGKRTAIITWDPWIVFRPALTSSGAVTLKDAFDANAKAAPGAAFDAIRHRGRMNVAFADGHVDSVPISSGTLSRVYLLPK